MLQLRLVFRSTWIRFLVGKKTKIDFLHLDFFRGRENLRVVQKTEGQHDWMKTVGGVVIAKPCSMMKHSNAVSNEYLKRKRPKYNFFHLNFLRGRENLRVIRNTKWHHYCMKTVGGVAIAKPCIDRTEIQDEIDELLSAKWSTWNTLQ